MSIVIQPLYDIIMIGIVVRSMIHTVVSVGLQYHTRVPTFQECQVENSSRNDYLFKGIKDRKKGVIMRK